VKQVAQSDWHISKTVPLSLIFGLIVQGTVIVWTVSMMMADIETNRNDISRMENRLVSVEEAVHDQAISMARIDENLKAIRGAVEKLATRQTKNH